MKWVKDDAFTYHYVLEKGDKEYRKTLKKNETNIFAIIYTQQRTKVMANMKVLRVKKPRYKLAMGGLEGHLYFKTLKDAKKFAEKTYEWMLAEEIISEINKEIDAKIDSSAGGASWAN